MRLLVIDPIYVHNCSEEGDDYKSYMHMLNMQSSHNRDTSLQSDYFHGKQSENHMTSDLLILSDTLLSSKKTLSRIG